MNDLSCGRPYKNVSTTFFRFVTIHVFDRQTDIVTDRQTDRKTFAIPCAALYAVAQ